VNSFTHPLGRAPESVLRCGHHSKLKGVLGEGNVAHTAMSGNGTTAGDDPLQTAVWRLRSRACWVDAAALIEPDTPQAALQRTSLLVERCLYTEQGWEEAEDALRTAEAQARTDDERGAAACERGQLAYAATLLRVRDRADEARAALGRAAALIPPGAPGRALLDFRRGVLAENLARSPQAARAAYRRAHAGATAHEDLLLQSFTWRHLAGLALRDGELAEARHGFAESLRIREELGYRRPRGDRVRTGGVPAPRGGGTVVPAARRRTDVAGPAVGATAGRDGLRGRDAKVRLGALSGAGRWGFSRSSPRP
jgi:tetratricopeptide (TPR) repeat protein